MEIVPVPANERTTYNRFINQHYPPVGAFMQTWEWGTFQQILGRKIERCFVTAGNEPIAAFTLVRHKLPLGFSYGYIPRGPVIATRAAQEDKTLELFKTIRTWAVKNFPSLLFLRLEPPTSSVVRGISQQEFFVPSYYVQPRHNHTVSINAAEEEIFSEFHPSTRSNIRRAEKRGVTVKIKPRLEPADYNEFFSMMEETIQRNSGKNAYPNHSYFHALAKIISPPAEIYNPDDLSLGVFFGYQHDKPAAAHFVLFFGDTATYLYGASYSDLLRSKTTTYLHWAAIKEAKRRGLRYYDLGGIDEKRWPTLTNFKRQFRGKESSYIGNIDIPIRPNLYRVYNFLRGFKK